MERVLADIYGLGALIAAGSLTFDAALEAFPEAQQLELQGEGESLLHPQFFDMAARAGQRAGDFDTIAVGQTLGAGGGCPAGIARTGAGRAGQALTALAGC